MTTNVSIIPLFYLYTSVSIIAALLVISAINPIHAVLYLILVFFATTGLMIILRVDFLAMIFLIVYVGAIAVLFLFVVMMLNIKVIISGSTSIRLLPVSGAIAFIFLYVIFLWLSMIYFPIQTSGIFDSSLKDLSIVDWMEEMNHYPSIMNMSSLLYVLYMELFLISAIILLVGMVGAIVLTLVNKNVIKKQISYKQTARKGEINNKE